ncbi:carbohydrate ABC transporter permease [Treponema primitia]|uniref:carbohydrate ABC transporter permease n=1 Tax=Treponema primitia TaxID=88058 RepID=UPI0002E33D2B|nr:carbohydrate ABC transporter permease [Treponema primitia]
MRHGINFKLDAGIMSFRNYLLLLTENNALYFRWYFNSVAIALIQTVVSVVLSAGVGYALAVYNFKGRNLVFFLVLIVMMVPVEILLLPLYKIAIGLNIYNTYAGIILPYAVSAYAVFFFRQYATGLPKEFIDAARIDSCGEFRIFVQIMFPLMKPAVGAMTILQAMGSWNAFVWPMIVTGDRLKMTLPVGLSTMITPYGNNYDMLMPGAVLAVIPIAIIFIMKQSAFIDGMTIGGVKG